MQNGPSADGLILSCANLRTLEGIPLLEDRLGNPAVSANQATTWHACALAGVDWTETRSPVPAAPGRGGGPGRTSRRVDGRNQPDTYQLTGRPPAIRATGKPQR